MKRKIRPAEEEMGNVVFLILFVILWYSSLIGSLLTGGIHTTALLFLWRDCFRCIPLLL